MEDLMCKEVDFDISDVDESDNNNSMSTLTKIYFIMKDFLDILNANAILSEFKLKVIASGYQMTKTQLIIIFYIVNKW